MNLNSVNKSRLFALFYSLSDSFHHGFWLKNNTQHNRRCFLSNKTNLQFIYICDRIKLNTIKVQIRLEFFFIKKNVARPIYLLSQCKYMFAHNFLNCTHFCGIKRKKNYWNEFDLIKLNFIVTAEADVEFSSKLSARGMSNTEISGLEKPSTMLTSLEDYVRNVFTR